MAQPLLTAKIPKSGLKSFSAVVKKWDNALVAATSSDTLGSLLVQRIKKRMAAGQDADGGQFDGILPSTIKWRQAAINNPKSAGYSSGGGRLGAKPLMFSKRLWNSIKVGKEGGVRINTGSGFRIVADATNSRGEEYGIVHQLGLGDVPQREFLKLNNSDSSAVEQRMSQVMRARS